MRCLLNALQLRHKCCQHVHMFQTWPNLSHAHEQFYSKGDTQRGRAWLPCLGSLPNPCRRLQQANLISSRVGCALFPAAAQRSMGNWKWSRRRWCLLGVFPLGCKSWAAQLHLLSATHWQNFSFPITVLEWPWLPSAQVPVLPDTHACGRNRQQPCAAFGERVEEEEGNSCPTFTPMNQICVQILFFHLHGKETD